MFRTAINLSLAFAMAASTVLAQDAARAPVTEAQPLPKPENTPPAAEPAQAKPADQSPIEDLWAPSSGLSLKNSTIFMEGKGRTIADEIKIDLIDVEGIMRALDESQREKLVRLSLADCIQLALAQNTDIQIAAIEPLIANADIQTAKGEFDPAAQLKGLYSYSQVALSQEYVAYSGIAAIRNFQTTLDAQLGGKLQTGTIWGIVGNMQKQENTYGQFIEQFNTQVALTLTQPVLRGSGLKYNRVRITAAKNNRRLSEAQLRLKTMTTVGEVIKAYWDLVGAVEAVQVNRGSLDNAGRLLEVNETRREIGTAADIDVLSAKTGVASRQSDLISARARVGDASDRLKQLMNMREGEMFSRMLVVPVDRPNVSEELNFDPKEYEAHLEESIDKALKNRPELEISDINLENAELQEYKAKHDLLPQLDLNGSYGQGGRDHQVTQTLTDIRDRQQVVYSYGFQATVPIGNRAARGQYEHTRLQRRQAELQNQRARTDIMATVELIARAVLTNKTLVESNQQAVRLKQAEVAAEESRLRLGVTTSWQVLQIQQQLTLSETALLQSQIAYEKSLIDLQTAQGTLLDSLEIKIAPPTDDEQIGYFESLRPHWD